VNSTVAPLSTQIVNIIFGHEQADMKTFSIALNQFKKTLLPLEKHL